MISIKPVTDPATTSGFQPITGDTFRGVERPIDLITMAYNSRTTPLRARQVVGAPDWLTSERFSINAKARTKISGIGPSMQSLLADRFRLTAHWDRQPVPVYALVVARSDGRLGPHLRPSTLSDGDCAARRQHPSAEAVVCGGTRTTSNGFTTARNSLGLVTAFIQSQGAVDRIVLDHTGLSGLYDAEFRTLDDAGEPLSVFTAVQEQLGLKLEPAREPMDVLVSTTSNGRPATSRRDAT